LRKPLSSNDYAEIMGSTCYIEGVLSVAAAMDGAAQHDPQKTLIDGMLNEIYMIRSVIRKYNPECAEPEEA